MVRPRTSWIDAYIGAKIRMARQISGQSQQELAKALDVTFQQVQKYEQGTNRIPVSKLLTASKLLSQPLAFFVPDLDVPRGLHDDRGGAEPHAALFAKNADEAALLETFRKIGNASVRRGVLALIQEITTRGTD